MYYYYAFGFSIASELECPELLPADASTKPAEIEIRLGMVPEILANGVELNFYSQASASEYLLNVDFIARYLVQDGKRITIQPEAQANLQAVRIYLLGSAIGALLHQKKIIPLHAGAVNLNGQAIVISGKSGAGKSTTAHTFIERGYHLLTDDICVLRNINGKAMVCADYPNMKMWRYTLQNKGINAEELLPIITDTGKYIVPVANAYSEKPQELSRIYILHSWNKPELKFEPLYGMEKFLAIMRNVYRPELQKVFHSTSTLMQEFAHILPQIPVTRIYRPSYKNTMTEIVDKILEDMQHA